MNNTNQDIRNSVNCNTVILDRINILSLVEKSKDKQASDKTLNIDSVFALTATSAKKDILEKIVSPLLDCKPVDDNAFNPTSANALIEEQVPLETLNSAFKELPQKLVEIDAAAFAQELTLIDKEHFLSISWHELSTCGWMKKDKVRRSKNVLLF